MGASDERHDSGAGAYGWIIAAGFLCEAVYLAAFYIGDFLHHPFGYLLCHFTLAAIYVPVVYACLRRVSSGGKPDRLIWIVLGFAIIFRITLASLTPTLSDDIYRYIWDGKVFLSGVNTYRYPPGAEPLAHLRDELYPLINHKNIGTPYTPLTELVFASVMKLAPSITAMKVPFIIFDILTMLTLIRLLKATGKPPLMVVAYAWNPLVLFEISGSGHADSLAIFFMTLCLTLLTVGKKTFGACSAALAWLSKYFAIILFPILLRRLAAWQWAWLVCIVILFYLPFLTYIENHFLSIHTVASSWRFNDSFFSLFLWATGSDFAAKAISSIIFLIVCVIVYLWKKPDTYSVFVLVGAMLLLSTTVHPWYIVWIVPWLCLYPSPAWLYLTSSAPISYLLLTSYASANPFETEEVVRAVVYGPFFLLIVTRWAIRLLKIKT